MAPTRTRSDPELHTHLRNDIDPVSARKLDLQDILKALQSGRLRVVGRPHSAVRVFKPRMEIFDDPASPNTIATFELPGVKPQTGHLDVVVTKNKLVVRGQRLARFGVDSEPESHTPQKLSLFPLRELRYGSFYRAVTLPRGVDATGMTTSFKDGLLTISWARPDPGVGNTTGNKDNAATDGCDEEGEEDENTSGLGSRAASGRLISNRNNQTWEDVPGRGGRERC